MNIVFKDQPWRGVRVANLDELAKYERMVPQNEEHLRYDYVLLNGMRAFVWLSGLPDTAENRAQIDVRFALRDVEQMMREMDYAAELAVGRDQAASVLP